MVQDTEQPDHIAQSVLALTRRTRRALSPWVRRCLGVEHEAADVRRRGAPLAGPALPLLTRQPERAGRHRGPRQTAFTVASTRSLAGRVQRAVEEGTVWRPDVGSLKPAMVARFADAIVGRFPPIGDRYRPRPPEAEAAPELELPPAGGFMAPDLGPEPSLERDVAPAPPPAPPPLPGQAAPKVRRTVAPPPATDRPGPTFPKGARLFARVEELPAEGESPTGDEPPEMPAEGEPLGRQPAQAGPARTDRDAEASAGAEQAAPAEPARPQIERKAPEPSLPRPARQREPSVRPPRESAPASAAEGARLLTRLASPRRLPLTKPPPLTHRQATAHLVSRGWRFKRKESSAPAAPDLVARAVDDLEGTTGPGRPLAPKPRVMMESVLGRDFSDVRIHTARLAPLNVQAATKGRDVYVEPGQDRFETPESLSLLGHELTHVAQGGGLVSTKPVAQTAILPQARAPARLESEEAEAESAEQTVLDLFQPATVQRAEAAEADTGLSLPVSSVDRSASAKWVQRQPFTSPLDTWEGEEALVEEAGEAEEEVGLPEPEEMEDEEDYLSETEEEEEEEELPEEEEPREKLDLDRLARQVYPLIKRLLAVERERMTR